MSNQDYYLYSRFQPVAPSGQTVTVAVGQTLGTVVDGHDVLATAPGLVTLHVEGPQMDLSENDIAGLYPTPGSADTPDNFLAHIALNRRTLPWERTGPAPGAPWLALLVLTDADMIYPVNVQPPARGPAPLVVEAKSAQIQAAGNPSLGPAGNLSPGALRWLATSTSSRTPATHVLADLAKLDPATYAQLKGVKGLDAGPLRTIAVPPATLKQALPAQPADVADLCHAKTAPDGTTVSIVVGARLPTAVPDAQNQQRLEHTAALVSLENRGDLWTRFSETAPIHLVVLHSWTFTPSAGGDFKDLCQGLREAGGVLRFGDLPKLPRFVPVRPGPQADPFVKALDSDGYLLDPLQLDGEAATIAWRGPLRPNPPPPRSAGFAVRADPESFDRTAGQTRPDYSHASAFELGRLLALADQGLLEDLRAVRLSINPPERFPNYAGLPKALQMPYWGESWSPDDTLQAAQWTGAAEFVGIANNPAKGDFSGIAAASGVNPATPETGAANWLTQTRAALATVVAAAPAVIDVTAADAALATVLQQQFPELVGAVAAEEGAGG